jgi:hypothetical protein
MRERCPTCRNYGYPLEWVQGSYRTCTACTSDVRRLLDRGAVRWVRE